MPHYLLCETLPDSLHIDPSSTFSFTPSAMPASKIPYIVPPSVIASKLGMDRTHISRILRGERVAEPWLAKQIAEAAGVAVSRLASHIAANKALAGDGVGRRKKAPTKVDDRVKGIILHCWRGPSGRPTYKAVVEHVEAETGVRVSRETVRQVVLKATKSSRRAA